MSAVLLTLGAAIAVAAASPPVPRLSPKGGPVFASAYVATGALYLPYAELVEPFTAYYDEDKGMSRIDYYDGEMKTYQIKAATKKAPNGASYKVVWSPNKETHVPEMTCYQVNGTAPGSIGIQTILPDLSDFKFVRTEPCPMEREQETCYRYELVVTVLERKSTYTFWAQQDEDGIATPVRYVMMGYDTLLGSHFDKYEVFYNTYTPGAQNDDVYDVYKVVDKCIAYPEGSGLSVKHLFNPMAEFIHNDESHLAEHFANFKDTFGKRYHPKEDLRRLNTFRQNMRYINSMNRRNLTFALKVNPHADWNDKELGRLRGRMLTARQPSKGRDFPHHEFLDRTLPDNVDWRLEGAVTPVKDQAICGSCWSFGTVGHLEGMYFLKTKRLVKFAEQELVDCSWNEGNGGCDGGLDFQAYNYIERYGLASDEQYGSYKGIDGKCHDTAIPNKPITTLRGYTNVSTVEDLQKAIAFVGPISVAIDASHKSLSYYSHGVYKDPDCSPTNLDHAVLAVGYGTLHGEPYWLIKNSWSTYWGNDGYVLISRVDNMCGVASQATYVEL